MNIPVIVRDCAPMARITCDGSSVALVQAAPLETAIARVESQVFDDLLTRSLAGADRRG